MKKSIKFLSLAILALATSCASPKKMAEMAENVKVACVPGVLEVVAGEIKADLEVSYPADYFHPQAILEVTPVIVYEGGESKLEPIIYQGEKVKDNYTVVPKDGGVVKESLVFEYVEGMEKSYLELRGVVKHKKKSYTLPSKKVADGANTTYMLVCTKGKIDYKADEYQEIIKQTAEGQFLYTINSSYVRYNQTKSESVKNFQSAIEEIKANERKALVSTDIVAYASPDGKEDQNNTLSNKRSESAEKAFNKVTKESPLDVPVNVKSIGEDWEGFQELVAKSDLEDKDLIIRVLSMYSDPAVREKEIKNMSAVYKTLAADVLPELRRARFIANVEYTNFTSEELLELIEENADVLDEEALLRTATLVNEPSKKIAIYEKAVAKFGSDRAQFNIAVANIKQGKIAAAKAALAKVENQDADYKNAMGVVALNEKDCAAAKEFFTAAGTCAANQNLAVVDILSGDYEAAAAKLADVEGYNKNLALVLTGKADQAKELKCACPCSSYLNAVIAARKGDAEGVKTFLKAASEDKELAEKATKDVEFAKFN